MRGIAGGITSCVTYLGIPLGSSVPPGMGSAYAGPAPRKKDEDSVILPDNLELMPGSGPFPGPPPSQPPRP